MAERARIYGFGSPFSLDHSSNSTRRPRLFDWTWNPSQATVPVTVCMDKGILDGLDLPGRKIAWLAESPAILVWQRISVGVKQRLGEILEAYEVLLTSDRSLCLLDPRIRYHPAGSNLPYIPESEYALHPKQKLCSMFASPKRMVRGHEIRHCYAEKLRDRLDLFGGACGSPRLGHGSYPDKTEGLAPYRFHVAMENCRVDLYYTEKLTDCFATGTVPIYWGSAAIGEIFDEAGILRLDEDFDPRMLSAELYESMLPAIRENFARLKRLESADDQLYLGYAGGHMKSKARYSQAGQDRFALAMLGDDHSGTFVDVGCADPFGINNTALLEELGWRGIALDHRDFADEWSARGTPFVRADALSCDYARLFSEHDLSTPIDFLSIDLERPGDRFAALERVLASGTLFKVICVEHDAYKGRSHIEVEREPQRRLLDALGYVLVCADVGTSPPLPFEDWWIHPGHVPESRSAPFRADGQGFRQVFAAAGVDLDMPPGPHPSPPEPVSPPKTRPRVLLFGDPGYRAPQSFDWTGDAAEATRDVAVMVGADILKQLDRPGRKIAWLRESPSISVWQRITQAILRELDRYAEAYEVILSCDRRLCQVHPVLQYNPAGANLPWPWIDEADYGIYPKSKLCSMFASPKLMVDGHVARHRVAHRFKDQLDLYGGAWGSPRLGSGSHPDKREGLVDYRFHVAMENCRVDLYYTEKLTDCFAVGTVPVYWGCDAIGEVFDTAGIVRLDDDLRIESLSAERYQEMLPAVRHNLELLRSLESSADRLYRKFISGD